MPSFDDFSNFLTQIHIFLQHAAMCIDLFLMYFHFPFYVCLNATIGYNTFNIFCVNIKLSGLFLETDLHFLSFKGKEKEDKCFPKG